MRCYSVIAKDGDTIIATRYAGTNALARETREELMAQFDLPKKKVEIEQAEIPVGKEPLLEFVNELLKAQDKGETEGDE